MGFLTAALVLGAGSAAYGAANARKQRKTAEADMARNRIAARENARLNQTQDETGAVIVLGDNGDPDTTKAKRKPTRQPPPTGGLMVGTSVGTTAFGTSSSVGGL